MHPSSIITAEHESEKLMNMCRWWRSVIFRYYWVRVASLSSAVGRQPMAEILKQTNPVILADDLRIRLRSNSTIERLNKIINTDR